VTVSAHYAESGLTDLMDRAELLLGQRRHAAQWWVDLVACLDAMGARLSSMRQEPAVRDSLAEQIRIDAPHLFSNLRRLEEESEALQEDILRVRIFAGESAADDGTFSDLAAAVRGVLRRMRKLEKRSNSVVLDAYDTDIGGDA